MKKTLFFLLTLIFSFNTFANLDESDVIDALKGRYLISMAGENHVFLLRSSGAVQLIDQEGEIDAAEINYSYSTESWSMNGLPVAHITFLHASDEQARDYHILLTVEQDWSSSEKTIRLIHAFTTYNDGPNENSYFEGEFSPELKKYSTETKRYEAIQ